MINSKVHGQIEDINAAIQKKSHAEVGHQLAPEGACPVLTSQSSPQIQFSVVYNH